MQVFDFHDGVETPRVIQPWTLPESSKEGVIGFAFFEKIVGRPTTRGNILSALMKSHQNNWHCEVAFPKEYLPADHPLKHTGIKEGKVVAYGIMARNPIDGTKGTVFEMDREFSSPQYKWVWCKVPYPLYLKALKVAQLQVGKPYDPSGHTRILWNPRPSTPDGRSWYCTNLTTLIGKQAVNTLFGVHPGAICTDKLREKVEAYKNKTFYTPPALASRIQRENDQMKRNLSGAYMNSSVCIRKSSPMEDTSQYVKMVKHNS